MSADLSSTILDHNPDTTRLFTPYELTAQYLLPSAFKLVALHPQNVLSLQAHQGQPNYLDNLPNELLREIFIIIWNDLYTPFSLQEDCFKLPYTLTLVSKRWKEITLDTAILWSIIHLSKPFHSSKKLDPLNVEHHLKLSKTLPISVTISSGVHFTAFNYDFENNMRQFYDSLLPHRKRIGTLYLESIGALGWNSLYGLLGHGPSDLYRYWNTKLPPNTRIDPPIEYRRIRWEDGSEEAAKASAYLIWA